MSKPKSEMSKVLMVVLIVIGVCVLGLGAIVLCGIVSAIAIPAFLKHSKRPGVSYIQVKPVTDSDVNKQYKRFIAQDNTFNS